MKIIILHPHFNYPGGASRYILEVGERLAKKGFDLLVVTTTANKEVIKTYPHLKFHFLGGPSTGSFLFWLFYPIFQLRLHFFLNRFPKKILFPQIFPPAWWAGIYKRFHPETPVVFMCQEPSAFVHSPLVIESLEQPTKSILKAGKFLFKAFDFWIVKNIDYIIGNSKYGASLIKKIYGRKADVIAYPSVDTCRFKPTKTKKQYIFTASRLDRQKNIDVLLKAFSLLPKKLVKDYKIIIGGDGTERKNLEELVCNLGIADRVKFLGWIKESELPRWYAQASLVVFCAKEEPFGIIPLEAMSSGTAVIATNSGGIKESVIDKKTGFLVEPKNPEALSEKIEIVLKDKRSLDNIVVNARKHVLENFTWDKTARKINNLIKKVVANMNEKENFNKALKYSDKQEFTGRQKFFLGFLFFLIFLNFITVARQVREGLAIINFYKEDTLPIDKERVCFQIGFALCNYYDFIKKNTPETAVILVPPQGYPWPATGNVSYSRYFLYPRRLINGQEKEPGVDLKKEGVSFVLIDWGEKELEYDFTNGWPKFPLSAKKIIYEDGQTLFSDYNPQDPINVGKRGVIELDQERL